MDAFAAVGLVVVIAAAILLADPSSKVAVAKWMICQARAQMAARAAAAAARRESERFDGELTHAINDFVAAAAASAARGVQHSGRRTPPLNHEQARAPIG
jgi:hypothetical protein